MKKKIPKKVAVLLLVLPILIMSVAAVGIAYLAGDINGDGDVNGKDLTRMMRYLSGEDAEVINGNLDTNGDGDVNGKDLTRLMRYISGEEIELFGGVKNNDTITCTSFVYGQSESGRDLVCYQICGDTYERTVLLNFAIHGYEDEYDADGQVLVELANGLIKHYSTEEDMKDCRLLIVPCANPDGLYDGYTNNGFGRCNANGVDLNRDFDANYTSNSSARNYTPYAFSASESRAIRDLCLEYEPEVVIDFHGWLNETIGDSEMAEVFYQEMSLTHYVGFTSTNCPGYFSNWAHQNGALSLLVEFTASGSVDNDKLIAAVDRLIEGNYDGGGGADYCLNSTYGQFTSIQGYTISDKRVTTYAGFDTPFSTTSYIDGEKDLCTILRIYENGWVKVNYPTASGTKTGYCYLSDFFDSGNLIELYTAHTKETTTVFSKPDMETSLGSVWKTDEFYVIADNGIQVQIIYPIDSGGWKLGWILKSTIAE